MFSYTSIFKSRQTVFWIVLVLIMLLFIEYNIYRFYIVGVPGEVKELEMEKFWMNKVSGSECYNMVMLGDSRVYIGLSPFEIASEVPGETMNLAFDSGGLNAELFKWVDDKKLKKIGENRVVIMGISPYSLSSEARQNINLNKYLRQVANTNEMADKYGVNKVLRHFFAPINVLGKSATGMQVVRNDKDPNSKEERVFFDNGWNEWHSELKESRVKEAPIEYEFIFKVTKVDDNSLRETYNWTKRWSDDGVLVVGVRMPLVEPLKKVENEQSGFNEAQFKKDFEAAGGVYIPFEHGDYLLFDGSHLEAASSRRFSKNLGQMIAGILSERNAAGSAQK